MLARDDTGWGNTPTSVSASPVAERFELERTRLVVVFCVSALWRRDVTETELRCLTDACTTHTSQHPAGSILLFARARSRQLYHGARSTRTALGRCSMPTLKSHRQIRQSSPTLPKR